MAFIKCLVRIMSMTIIGCILLSVVCVNSQRPEYEYSQFINPGSIYFPDYSPSPTWQVPTPNAQFTPDIDQQALKRSSASNGFIKQSETEARANKKYHFDETSTALTSFTINLMKTVTRLSTGNTVVSAHSIATLLALLQQGASGATLEELSAALQMNQQGSAKAFKAHAEDLKTRKSSNILKTANNIYIADGFTLNLNFRQIALKDFRSDVTPINFVEADRTAREINSWVARQTEDKIQNLITPDSIDSNTQMVLVNAMYFKGLWEIPFRKQATSPDNFLLSSGKIIKAQFMTAKRYFRTGMDPYTAAHVIVIPFELDEYSLMVIKPNELSSIQDTLDTLTTAQLETYLNFHYLETRLLIPKFTVKAETDLSILLKQMNVSKLFTESELTKIGTYHGGRSPHVSSAVHSAALTIDEEGGTAAASTAFAAVALSNDEELVLKINRPFLAVIWDNKASLPLFTARIENPTL